MDQFEVIALFLLSGIAAAGVSLPLNRCLNKPWFWVVCILTVCVYTLLVSKQCRTAPDFTIGYTRAFDELPLFVYLSNALTAALYIVTALFCSHVYEKERFEQKNSGKIWLLNRWFGLVAGGFLALLLYSASFSGGILIFFSTVASMAFCIFALIFAYFVPMLVFIRQKRRF